jgi:translation elongation factor EF-1alpha
MAEEKEIGIISSYFGNVGVAAIKLSGSLKKGDKIRIKGHTSDFEEQVNSIQADKKELEEAKKGDHIGIKVSEKVRPNDKVFLVE